MDVLRLPTNSNLSLGNSLKTVISKLVHGSNDYSVGIGTIYFKMYQHALLFGILVLRPGHIAAVYP